MPSGLETAGLIVAASVPTVVLMSLSQRLRGLVVGFIGDSYALLHQDGPRSAIVDRVTTDLAKLEATADGAPVVILAHSQGAEIARRVLAARPPEAGPVAGLVTFGAGIAKLHAVDRLCDQRRRSWAAFALRWVSAAGVIAATVLVVRRPDVGRPGDARRRDRARRPVGARAEDGALGAAADRRRVPEAGGAGGRPPPGRPLDRPARLARSGLRGRPAGGEAHPRVLAHDRQPRLARARPRRLLRNHEGFLATVALEIERVADGHVNPVRPPALVAAEAARAKMIGAIGPLRLAVAAIVVELWIGARARPSRRRRHRGGRGRVARGPVVRRARPCPGTDASAAERRTARGEARPVAGGREGEHGRRPRQNDETPDRSGVRVIGAIGSTARLSGSDQAEALSVRPTDGASLAGA